MQRLLKNIDRNVLAWGFFVSAAASIASLILSDIVGFIPCDLCWYQRLLMYPIPVILGVALLRQDKHAYMYVLPFSVVGAVIALYQSLLQWGVISETSLTCSITNRSCAEPEIQWLGFLTIPFGSFLSFMAINFLMWRARKVSGGATVTRKGQKQLQDMILLIGGLTVVAVALITLFR